MGDLVWCDVVQGGQPVSPKHVRSGHGSPRKTPRQSSGEQSSPSHLVVQCCRL